VYILTNLTKTVLYTGVTNSLEIRIAQHKADALGSQKTFAGKYYCYYLVYVEHFPQIDVAIAREKEIKNLTRRRKEELINSMNPEWKFLNEEW